MTARAGNTGLHRSVSSGRSKCVSGKYRLDRPGCRTELRDAVVMKVCGALALGWSAEVRAIGIVWY